MIPPESVAPWSYHDDGPTASYVWDYKHDANGNPVHYHAPGLKVCCASPGTGGIWYTMPGERCGHDVDIATFDQQAVDAFSNKGGDE